MKSFGLVFLLSSGVVTGVAVEGTLFFDKDTYQLANFKYEIAFSSEISDEDTDSVKLVKTKFTCEGESKRGVPEDHIEPLNPTVYDDVAEFLKDVNEQVVPPNIYL